MVPAVADQAAAYRRWKDVPLTGLAQPEMKEGGVREKWWVGSRLEQLGGRTPPWEKKELRTPLFWGGVQKIISALQPGDSNVQGFLAKGNKKNWQKEKSAFRRKFF